MNRLFKNCRTALLVALLLAGTVAAWPFSNGNRQFESELTTFREGIYRHFPDLEDSTMTFKVMMARLDSLCESFLNAHKREIDAEFDVRLRQLPELRDVDTTAYVRTDTLPLDGLGAYETLLQPEAALLKMTNIYPDAMATSYRTLLMAHEQGASWLGQYYMLNSIGKPKIGRGRLTGKRAVVLLDTWLDFTRLELVRRDNHWQAQRIERWVRRSKSK